MKKVIIFDVDGVLLNSEKLYMEMNQLFFKELGVNISIAEHQKFIGLSATKMWSFIKDKFNLTIPVAELINQEKELKYKMLSDTKLVPTPGVVEFLQLLKQKELTVAIASSGLKKNIAVILNKLKLQHYFQFIVSGEDVIKGKPEPDIFFKVANYFKFLPEHCVVIEDSTNGVLAANAAGMFCVGFSNPDSGNQDLSTANIIIDNFFDKQLLDLIA